MCLRGSPKNAFFPLSTSPFTLIFPFPLHHHSPMSIPPSDLRAITQMITLHVKQTVNVSVPSRTSKTYYFGVKVCCARVGLPAHVCRVPFRAVTESGTLPSR